MKIEIDDEEGRTFGQIEVYGKIVPVDIETRTIEMIDFVALNGGSYGWSLDISTGYIPILCHFAGGQLGDNVEYYLVVNVKQAITVFDAIHRNNRQTESEDPEPPQLTEREWVIACPKASWLVLMLAEKIPIPELMKVFFAIDYTSSHWAYKCLKDWATGKKYAYELDNLAREEEKENDDNFIKTLKLFAIAAKADSGEDAYRALSTALSLWEQDSYPALEILLELKNYYMKLGN